MKTKLLSLNTSKQLIDKLEAVDFILWQLISLSAESDLAPRVRATLVNVSWDIRHAKRDIENISEL